SRGYHEVKFGEIEPGDFIWIDRLWVGINYHRKVYQSKYFDIHALGGITYGSYSAAIFELWTSNLHWHEPVIKGNARDTYVGLQLGGNINVPIWRGLYFNGNLRLGAVPWAKHDYFRYSTVVNLGLGYKF